MASLAFKSSSKHAFTLALSFLQVLIVTFFIDKRINILHVSHSVQLLNPPLVPKFCGVSLLSNDAYDKLKIACPVLLNIQFDLKNAQTRVYCCLCKAIVKTIIPFAFEKSLQNTDVNQLLQSDSYCNEIVNYTE